MAEKAAKSALPDIVLNADDRTLQELDAFTAGMKEEERDAYLKEIERIAASRGTGFGRQAQKLALPQRPGYKRHWFNDTPGRVDDALTNGWAHVKDKKGKEVKRVVGTARQGGPLFAYAMEIPLFFWMQDKRRRNQEAKDRMDQIGGKQVSVPSGMAKPSDSKAFYTPNANKEVLSIRETLAVQQRPEKAA